MRVGLQPGADVPPVHYQLDKPVGRDVPEGSAPEGCVIRFVPVRRTETGQQVMQLGGRGAEMGEDVVAQGLPSGARCAVSAAKAAAGVGPDHWRPAGGAASPCTLRAIMSVYTSASMRWATTSRTSQRAQALGVRQAAGGRVVRYCVRRSDSARMSLTVSAGASICSPSCPHRRSSGGLSVREDTLFGVEKESLAT